MGAACAVPADGAADAPPTIARAVSAALPLAAAHLSERPVSEAWIDECREAPDAVRRQVSLPNLLQLRRMRSASDVCSSVGKAREQLRAARQRMLSAGSSLEATTPRDQASQNQLADVSDAHDGHGAFPSLNQMEFHGLTTNLVKLTSIFTPAANVLSMGMTVGTMAGGDEPHPQAENTRSAVSLAMDSLSLGLWAGSTVCAPLAVAAVGVSAADFAVGAAYDFFADAPEATPQE